LLPCVTDGDTCVDSLPRAWFNAVENLSYFSDIADVHDPIVAILAKCLPTRCQARKYGVVTEKFTLEGPKEHDRFRKLQDMLQRALEPQRKRKRNKAGIGERPEDVRFMQAFRAVSGRRHELLRIVLCSLLALYPHCDPATRPSERTQRMLRVLFLERPSLAFFQAILHNCAPLIVWSLREFITYVLRHHPALLACVGSRIRFDKFEMHTRRAMRQIRSYLDCHLPYKWSWLGRHAYACLKPHSFVFCTCKYRQPNRKKGQPRTDRPACQYAHLWTTALKLRLQPYHHDILNHAYRKSDSGGSAATLSFLLGKEVRDRAPLVPLPTESEETAPEMEMDSDDAEDEDYRASCRDLLQTYPHDKGLEWNHNLSKEYKKTAVPLKLREAAQSVASSEDARVRARVFMYVRPCQFERLSTLVDAVHAAVPASDDAIVHLVRCLGPLGVDGVEQEQMLYLLRVHRTGTITKLRRLKCVERLQLQHPHAYNLLQIGAELLRHKETRSEYIVGYLSAEQARAQVEALQRRCETMFTVDHVAGARQAADNEQAARKKGRMDLAEELKQLQTTYRAREEHTRAVFRQTPCILPSNTVLRVCDICKAVYSNLHDPNPLFQRFYRFGLRDAVCSLSDGEVYCSRNRINHRGRCADVPLQRIPLLGVRYLFDRKPYQICVECGDLMIPDAEACKTDAKRGNGMLCCDCSKTFETPEAQLEEQIRRWRASLRPMCACCNSQHVSDTGMYLYPHGVWVCGTHHRAGMVEHMERIQPVDQTACIASIYVYHQRKRRECEERNKPQMERAKKRRRMIERLKK